MVTDSPIVESLGDLLAPCVSVIEADLERWLIEPLTPADLAEAMRYCTLSGGKRIRPALAHLSSQAVCGAVGEPARKAAVAVELVHCYSLVHDDLPAMDDDSLRRGRPTAHVRFGEAMAILTGDALLTRAFALLAETEQAGRLVAELALGAGPAGMIAGQVADMNLCQVPAGPEGLEYIHARKTAALIQAAARMGAICARADGPVLAAISEYARAIGLAFQLFDDLLDVTGSAQDLGKTAGKDARAGKRTYASEMGLEPARRLGAELTRRAIRSLQPLAPKASKLIRLAELLADRTR
jgi:geranylgeranyl pyrophosphate synthase